MAAAARILICCLALWQAGTALAGPREEAQRMHNRLTGTPADDGMLDTMVSLINGNNPEQAARLATAEDGFYNVVLKNFATPWTNRDQNVFAPLNDYTATVIGLVRDNQDFRRVLHADVIYSGDPAQLSGLGIPPVSANNNDHYEALEEEHVPLQDVLVSRQQSSLYGLPAEATAGVLTSRAAANAFFYAGTNRAMLRFTLMNHLCRDLEQLKDPTRPADRIRQDISRSPGGDSRIFINNCVACHAGMDPLAQAFAYYDWDGEEGAATGRITWNGPGQTDPQTGSRVTAKHRINENNFIHGFVIPDDRWDNYWRDGANAVLGWDESLPGGGHGARSMGMELAHSQAFAECQARKVFRRVCLRDPASGADITQIEDMTTTFRNSGHNLRELFVESAVYCRAE